MSVPVIFFVFNRPDHTRQTLTALRNQTVRPRQLFVFADGARNAEEAPRIEAVRQLVRAVDWADVQLVARDCNFGCAPNILQGITEALQTHDKAIILEDDTLPATRMYESLCLLLQYYEHATQVFSVGGYPSIKRHALWRYRYDVVLSPRFSCWAWGTWSNRWQTIVADLWPGFTSPFASPDDVPLDAGFDLRGGLTRVAKRPGFYWDIPVALLCLHYGLLHALTKHYLVTNIGIGAGPDGKANQAVRQFMRYHNRVQDQVPRRLPAPAPQPQVNQAVQRYIQDINKVQRQAAAPDMLQRLGRHLWQRLVHPLLAKEHMQ